MQSLCGEHVVDMITLVRVMVEVERLLWLLTVPTFTLAMIKAVESALPEKCNEVGELVSTRRPVEYKTGVKVACPDNFRTVDQGFVGIECLKQWPDVTAPVNSERQSPDCEK
jgi:hypothetical protein